MSSSVPSPLRGRHRYPMALVLDGQSATRVSPHVGLRYGYICITGWGFPTLAARTPEHPRGAVAFFRCGSALGCLRPPSSQSTRVPPLAPLAPLFLGPAPAPPELGVHPGLQPADWTDGLRRGRIEAPIPYIRVGQNKGDCGQWVGRIDQTDSGPIHGDEYA